MSGCCAGRTGTSNQNVGVDNLRWDTDLEDFRVEQASHRSAEQPSDKSVLPNLLLQQERLQDVCQAVP